MSPRGQEGRPSVCSMTGVLADVSCSPETTFPVNVVSRSSEAPVMHFFSSLGCLLTEALVSPAPTTCSSPRV